MLQLALIFAFVLSVGAFSPVKRFAVSTSRTLSMVAKEGDKVPIVVFKARVRDETIPGPNPFKWKDVTSDDLFKGKRVVVFALPGGNVN
jgi:hypothetical protein